MSKIKVLFVCMGNICRSPSAQGVFEKLIKSQNLENKFYIESSGTHSYHVGSQPDSRSIKAAMAKNIDISHQRARQLVSKDFKNFDLIIAMDDDNILNIKKICPKNYLHKIKTMMHYMPSSDYSMIPDPYYGSENGFELVLDLLHEACRGLLENLQATHKLK